MKARLFLAILVCCALLSVVTIMLTQAQEPLPEAQTTTLKALGTGFTYQGRLLLGGVPVTGTCDLQFTLWDAATDGTQVGITETKTAASIHNGLFTVVLDFGTAPFDGDARWLEVSVRCPAGSGSYTTLSPRQALTAVPYALYAKAAPWGGLAGVPPGFADGVDDDTLYSAGTGLTLVDTTFHVDTTTIQQRVSGVCGAGYAIRQVNADGTVLCEPVTGGAGDYWALTGNAGTTPGTHFLGTTDNQALDLKVNNQRALRIEPNADSPNVIGGSSGNGASEGVVGATIGGGGWGGWYNRVSNDYGTVAGGCGNHISGKYAFVGGGWVNYAEGFDAVIAGGLYNRGSGTAAVVGGGGSNVASGEYAVVGGGRGNQAVGIMTTIGGGEYISVTGSAGTVAGGSYITVTGDYASVGGGLHNVASGDGAVVGGGIGNSATGYGAVVGGGGGFEPHMGGGNSASGCVATVSGGCCNFATDYGAAVGGGWANSATGYDSIIPGGANNWASGSYSFAAGRRAKAKADGCFVWGDSTDADVTCSTNNQWVARTTGGAVFWSNSALTTGVIMYPGGGSWSNASDRELKENFSAVDRLELLKRLAALPVQTWNYKSQDPSICHIGPVAQDFYSAFGLGEDDKTISTIDAEGVSLAAVQGLYELSQEQAARIQELEGRLAALEAALANLLQETARGAP